MDHLKRAGSNIFELDVVGNRLSRIEAGSRRHGGWSES